MMDQDFQSQTVFTDSYGCKCDSEKVIFCFDKRTKHYTWSCSGHCFEQMPSQSVATQTATSRQYFTALENKTTTSCSQTKGTETDIYGIDRNEELVSLLKEALEVCTQRNESHAAIKNISLDSQKDTVNHSDTKHVEIENSRNDEEQEGIQDVSFCEKYNEVNSISDKGHLKRLDSSDIGSTCNDNEDDGDVDGDEFVDEGVADESIAIQIDSNDDEDENDDGGSVYQLDDDKDIDYVDDTDDNESNVSHSSYDISNPPTKEKQAGISSKNRHKDKSSLSREVFPCSYCTRRCTTRSIFEKHIQWHERSKETKCNICGKEFSKPGYLINHQEKHQVVRKQGAETTTGTETSTRTEHPLDKQLNLAECRHCGKLVKTKRLTGHEKSHALPRQKKTLVCSYCGKTFTSQKDFTRHVRTHTKEKPYKCDRCESAFYCNTELTIHIRRHVGDKRYKCDHCGKAFVRKCNLDDHLRTHTGARPYKCNYCDKSFGFRNVLKVHLVRHTGMWPHVCEYCEKGFAKKAFLNKHLMTHTGVKPYKCLNCAESFIDKASLTSHAQIHLAAESV